METRKAEHTSLFPHQRQSQGLRMVNNSGRLAPRLQGQTGKRSLAMMKIRVVHIEATSEEFPMERMSKDFLEL